MERPTTAVITDQKYYQDTISKLEKERDQLKETNEKLTQLVIKLTGEIYEIEF